jgi:hypothetical protein
MAAAGRIVPAPEVSGKSRIPDFLHTLRRGIRAFKSRWAARIMPAT